MKKHGKFYFDTTADIWKEWHDGATIDGFAVPVSNTVQAGLLGGTICQCPSGNRYKVGALIMANADSITTKLQTHKNYYNTCVDGTIDTTQIGQPDQSETNIELMDHGLRAVHCDVNGCKNF